MINNINTSCCVSVRQDTQKEVPENVSLDVYLMNGHKISISIVSTDQTEDILEVGRRVKTLVSTFANAVDVSVFMPPPSMRSFVRPSVIKIWSPLNNFWKTASIQFKFSMLIYNIKTQVEFDLGCNPLIFDGVMGLL